jgi:hypothetical protein
MGAARTGTARFAVSKRMAKGCIYAIFFTRRKVERKVLLNGVPERRKSVDKTAQKDRRGEPENECRQHEY